MTISEDLITWHGKTTQSVQCTITGSESDVTKFEFEFEFDNVRTFSPDSKFDECFKHFVVECEFVENACSTTDFISTDSQRAQTNQFFLKFNLSHKLQ